MPGNKEVPPHSHQVEPDQVYLADLPRQSLKRLRGGFTPRTRGGSGAGIGRCHHSEGRGASWGDKE